MSKNTPIDDLATFAISSAIDNDLKRSGEYRDDVRNKLASIGSSAGLGAVGTAIGGPVLGVLTGTLGHLIGQAVEFSDSNTSNPSFSKKKRIQFDYDHLQSPKFDYDKL